MSPVVTAADTSRRSASVVHRGRARETKKVETRAVHGDARNEKTKKNPTTMISVQLLRYHTTTVICINNPLERVFE